MDFRVLLTVGLTLLVLIQGSVALVQTPAQVAPQPGAPLGEPPIERWTATYGGQGADRGIDVVSVADGYVLGGSTTSFTTPTTQSDRRSDMWIVHVDADGQRTWARVLGTVGSETVRDLAATEDGGVLVAGELGVNEGSRLYKLDATGAVEWSRLFGSDRLARAGFAVDDRYVVVGDVVGEGATRSGAVAFVTAADDVQFEQLTGRTLAVETFTAVTETSDGSLLLAGESDRGEEEIDAWVVKLTPDGTVRWNRIVPDPNAELYPAAVVELEDGDVLVAGVKRRGNVDDGWLARLDGRTGDVLWQRSYDRLSFTDAAVNGRGALVVGSSFESRVTRDGLVLSVDAQGRELWRQTYGGSRDDVFEGLAPTPTGYLFVGWTDVDEDQRENVWAVAVDRPVTVSQLDVSPRSVAVGESVTVTATLTNRGADPRRHEVTLVVDGEARETQARQASVGNETTVSFELTFDTPGSHTVSVGEAGPVTVDVTSESAATATTTATDGPTPVPEPVDSPETTETESPGFGAGAVVVSAVVCVTALWLMLRRHES